jgi:endonuclease YncB( thermonuclease family)
MKSSWNQLFYVAGMVLAATPLAIYPSFSQADEQKTQATQSQVLKGEVFKVTDGDSIVVKTDEGRQEQIQLEGIDAPEFKQADGDKATDFLKELVLKKPVEIHWKERDNYKRILGTIFIDDEEHQLGDDYQRLGMAFRTI